MTCGLDVGTANKRFTFLHWSCFIAPPPIEQTYLSCSVIIVWG